MTRSAPARCICAGCPACVGLMPGRCGAWVAVDGARYCTWCADGSLAHEVGTGARVCACGAPVVVGIGGAP